MPSIPKDFRSDTVTRPTSAMRSAMAAAAVGDDVWGEDPTVIELQDCLAQRLGKEATLFVPSGTMSNLIGVRLHCRAGEAMICEAESHVYYYEQGGYAQVNGVIARPLQGLNGVLRLEQLEALPEHDNVHFPRTRLLCLENTHNRGGGRILPYENVETLCGWARRRGLRTHLDGARLWNAAVASGISPAQWSQHFDTVSVCFSKGLGAAVGSALAGPRDLIREALRHRKLFGGGMRQAGILAAAALYALDHHVDRLAEDHANARNWPPDCVNSPACGWNRRQSTRTWFTFILNRGDLRRGNWSSGFAAGASSCMRAGRFRSARSPILTSRRPTSKRRLTPWPRRLDHESVKASPSSINPDRFYRKIPCFWSLIDCSFGIFGIISLWIVRRMIRSDESYR